MQVRPAQCRFLGVVFAAMMLLTTAMPAAESPAASPIRVISYNVQFLPGPGRMVNKRKNLNYRAETIGRLMAEYDIVGLQETFDDEPRERLLASLKAQWGESFHTVVHPRPEDGRYNGGLLIATHWPILEENFTYFTVYSKPEDYGVTADGHAAKGVLHARIDLPGEGSDDFVDVFVTHLEARADELRPAQYAEMAAFIKKHADPRRPTLILGDLNTKGMIANRRDPDSQYNVMMREFGGARPGADLTDVWPHLMGEAHGGTTNQEDIEKGSRIDYVIVSNPREGGPALIPSAVRVNGFLDKEVVALSDHSGVEADFHWRPAE